MGEIPEPEAAKLTSESSSWLSMRVFYLKLSRCELNESMLDSLTITHTPLTSDTVLEVNGDMPGTKDNGQVSCPLRRDRVDTASREATFVSTETVRMAGSVRFEVRAGKDEKLLIGIMEMRDVLDGFGQVEKNGCWVMKCQVSMQRGSGFLKGGGEDAKSPVIEVYVASLFRGNPIVFTKAMKLRFRRKRQVKAPFMEPIPECGEHAEDAKETPPADQKHDPQELSEYRCYKPEPGIDDVDLDSLYARTAGLEGEDSDLPRRRHQPRHLPRRRHRRRTPGPFVPVHLQESEAAVNLRPALKRQLTFQRREPGHKQLCFSPNQCAIF